MNSKLIEGMMIGFLIFTAIPVGLLIIGLSWITLYLAVKELF